MTQLAQRSRGLRSALLGLAFVLAIGGLVAALAVDQRLDRQWGLRIAMYLLTLVSVAVLLRDRVSTRVIGVAGIVVWGGLAPIVTTASATSDEMDFALAVADRARTAATSTGGSVVLPEHVEAAVRSGGGAVGPRAGDPGPRGAATSDPDAFTVLARPDPERSRPRVCLTFRDYGFSVDIRRC